MGRIVFNSVKILFQAACGFVLWAMVPLLATMIIVRERPRRVPHPTEAYEGFGEYVVDSLLINTGLFLSLIAGMIGCLFAICRTERESGHDVVISSRN